MFISLSNAAQCLSVYCLHCEIYSKEATSELGNKMKLIKLDKKTRQTKLNSIYKETKTKTNEVQTIIKLTKKETDNLVLAACMVIIY